MQRLRARAPLLIAVAVGIAFGIVVGALFGRTSETANWVTAAATVALTAFAFIQLVQIEESRAAEVIGRQHRLQAFATLARRSCQAAAESVEYYLSTRAWAGSVSSGFDPLQSQFLEIRSLAGGLHEDTRQAATKAFDAFIAAADRINILASPNASMIESQEKELRAGALESLGEAASALRKISPKTDTERSLPAGFAQKIAEYPKI